MDKRLIAIVQDEETQMELSRVEMVIPDDEFYKMNESFNNGAKYGNEFTNDLMNKYGVVIREIDPELKTIDIIETTPINLPKRSLNGLNQSGRF